MALIISGMWVGIQFGILPITLAILLQLVGSQAPLTSDLSAWYGSKGLIVVALILMLAVWSFRNALGGRKVLQEDFRDHRRIYVKVDLASASQRNGVLRLQRALQSKNARGLSVRPQNSCFFVGVLLPLGSHRHRHLYPTAGFSDRKHQRNGASDRRVKGIRKFTASNPATKCGAAAAYSTSAGLPPRMTRTFCCGLA
jgi:hypothetical protein